METTEILKLQSAILLNLLVRSSRIALVRKRKMQRVDSILSSLVLVFIKGQQLRRQGKAGKRLIIPRCIMGLLKNRHLEQKKQTISTAAKKGTNR